MKSTCVMVARARSSIRRRVHGSRRYAFRMICICLMHLYVIWGRISTMSCLEICMHIWRIRWSFSSIHQWIRLSQKRRAATRLSARMHPIHVRIALYRLDEAEANGWRRFAMIWRFQRNQIVWILVCAWSFRQLYLRIWPMNFTRARLCTGLRNTATACVPSVWIQRGLL